MMEFRTVKTAILNTLGEGAEGRFQVVGFSRQSKSADELLSNDRMVRVRNSEGDFPKSASGMRGPKSHDVSYEIVMSVSAMAKGDLSVLDSPNATAIEKAAALAAVTEAAEEADIKTDELIDYVYQILMDARNEGLGLPVGDIANRWIDSWSKSEAFERGDLVVVTANMTYKCRVQEIVLGDIGNEPETAVFNSSVKVGDTEGAGVIAESTEED